MPRRSPKFEEKFGLIIRERREERGMTQVELAEAAGVNRTHISLIERGKRSVRLETVERLAKALQVQPAELMPKIKLRRR